MTVFAKTERSGALDAFLALFEGALDAYVLFDDALAIAGANPAACALLGVGPTEAAGQMLDRFVERAVVDRFDQLGGGELEVTRPDGDRREAEVRSIATF